VAGGGRSALCNVHAGPAQTLELPVATLQISLRLGYWMTRTFCATSNI